MAEQVIYKGMSLVVESENHTLLSTTYLLDDLSKAMQEGFNCWNLMSYERSLCRVCLI